MKMAKALTEAKRDIEDLKKNRIKPLHMLHDNTIQTDGSYDFRIALTSPIPTTENETQHRLRLFHNEFKILLKKHSICYMEGIFSEFEGKQEYSKS
jgi:hypothetical protein